MTIIPGFKVPWHEGEEKKSMIKLCMITYRLATFRAPAHLACLLPEPKNCFFVNKRSNIKKIKLPCAW